MNPQVRSLLRQSTQNEQKQESNDVPDARHVGERVFKKHEKSREDARRGYIRVNSSHPVRTHENAG